MGEGNLGFIKTMKIDRNKVFEKYKGKCAYCGKDIDMKELQVDHIIPKSTFSFHMQTRHKVPSFLSHLKEGDVNNIDNLHPSCSVCNLYKLNFSLEDFRNELTSLMDYLENKSRKFKLAKRYNFVESKEVKPIKFFFEYEQENRDN